MIDAFLVAEQAITISVLIRAICPPRSWVAESVGVSYGTVRNWASGASTPSRPNRKDLASLADSQWQVALSVARLMRMKAASARPLLPESLELGASGPSRYPEDIAEAVRCLSPSLKELAALVPVNYSTLRNWAAGYAVPGRADMARLADAADRHANSLLVAVLAFDSARVVNWVRVGAEA